MHFAENVLERRAGSGIPWVTKPMSNNDPEVEKPDAWYTADSQWRETKHRDADCRALSNAAAITQRPARAVSHLAECGHCCTDAEPNARESYDPHELRNALLEADPAEVGRP